MKRLALTCLSLICFATVAFAADVRVNGYVRQDGTYVQPHMRTAPDNTINNNYTTAPNVNPYTGQPGTIQPQPSYQPNPYVQPGNGQHKGY